VSELEEPLLITIGQITTAQGVHGEVRVLPLTDFPHRFSQLKEVTVVLREKVSKYRVLSARRHQRFVVLKLEGVNDPEQARQLRNALLKIPQEQLMPLPPGHYYIFQLVGLAVYTVEGNYVGKIEDIFRTGSNDVYQVRREDGKELLLPAIRQVVEKIDLEAGQIIIRPLAGLLDE